MLTPVDIENKVFKKAKIGDKYFEAHGKLRVFVQADCGKSAG